MQFLAVCLCHSPWRTTAVHRKPRGREPRSLHTVCNIVICLAALCIGAWPHNELTNPVYTNQWLKFTVQDRPPPVSSFTTRGHVKAAPCPRVRSLSSVIRGKRPWRGQSPAKSDHSEEWIHTWYVYVRSGTHSRPSFHPCRRFHRVAGESDTTGYNYWKLPFFLSLSYLSAVSNVKEIVSNSVEHDK